MAPRRRRTGEETSSDGGHDSGSATRPSESTGSADFSPDHIDTMAGRLADTGGRVDAVGTTLGGVNVGARSMGIVGSGFTGAAQTHVQAAREHVTRTRTAVQNAEDGTRVTARSYRDTEDTNVANLNNIDTTTDTPRTGTTTPAGHDTTPGGTTPPP